MQTDATVFTEVGQVALQQLNMPDPAPGQVQVRTLFSTISNGTEGWILADRFTWGKTPYPCVPGYQRVGVIESLGPQVGGWRVGDRVMATIGLWPGPVQPYSGAHVALGNTPVSELYAVPDSVSDVDASALVVAQVGYNAASRAVLQPGDWAVVYGDGLIGQFGAQALRARGARVILVGHRKGRLDLAAAHAADSVINAREQEVVKAVHQLTGGRAVTVVLDSIQTEKAQREYVPLLEKGQGQIVYTGFTPGTVWADMALLQQRELTTHFVSGWNRGRMESTLELMAKGRMQLRPLVTHLVPYSEAPAMYRMVQRKIAGILGITLDWRKG